MNHNSDIIIINLLVLVKIKFSESYAFYVYYLMKPCRAESYFVKLNFITLKIQN